MEVADNNFINNALSENKTFYSKMNRDFQNPLYLNGGFALGNDAFFNNSKKDKKDKIKKIFFCAFVGISTLTIAGFALFKNQTLLNHILKDAKNIPQNIANGANELGEHVLDASKTAQKNMKSGFIKFDCISTNFTNIKDDIWDRIAKFLKSKKIGVVDSLGQKVTNAYKKYVQNPANQKRYSEAIKRLNDAGVENCVPKDLNEFFKKCDGAIRESLDDFASQNNRITQNLFDFKQFRKSPVKTLKAFAQKVSAEKVADRRLADAYNKLLTIPKNATKEQIEAVNEYNRLALNLQNKIRDINIGSAPTDIIGILASLGTLGVVVGAEENKEKRKSIMLNLGIPVIGTMTTAMIATANCVSGGLGILLGLAIGKGASFCVKLIDDKINKKDTQDKK